MAIAFDNVSQTASTGLDNVSSATISHTLTSNSNGILLVGAMADSSTLANRTVSSITYNGINCTNIAGATADTGVTNRGEVWYILTPGIATGAHNIVVTWGGTCGGVIVFGLSLTGCDQTTIPDASANQTGTGSTITKSITTVADNAWILEWFLTNTSADNLAVNSGQTTRGTRVDDSTDSIMGHCSTKGPISPAAATSESWTRTSTTVQCVYSLVSVKPFVSTGVNPAVGMRSFMSMGHR